MTLQELKDHYDIRIQETEHSIMFYLSRNKDNQFSRVIEFYRGRLWVFRVFRRQLEELEK